MFNKLDTSSKVILKTVAVLLVLAFLWLVRDIVIVLLLSFVLASAMEPLVDYLKLKKIPRSLTVLAVYAFVFTLIGFILYLIMPVVFAQAALLIEGLPIYLEEVGQKIPALGRYVESNNSFYLSNLLSGDGVALFAHTFNLFNVLLYGLTILVISFYLVAEEQGMKKFVSTLVPVSKRASLMSVVVQIQRKMGLWVLGQCVLSISIFVVTFIALSLMGVKYALFLALIAGLLEVVPFIGPIIAAVPAMFFAFLQSPTLALAVAIVYVLIQKAESLVLVPKIMEKAIGLSPLAILIALLVGFKLASVAGLLLAVPILGIINILYEEYY